MYDAADADDEWEQFMPMSVPTVVRQAELDEVLAMSLEEWNRQRAKSSVPLSKELFPSKHREAWVELFITYNTALPSSAAVERLFSSGGDILRAKRSSLSASNFEKLVFMRGNMKLLGLKEVERQEEGAEEEEAEEVEQD
jgi:hypothetical protein